MLPNVASLRFLNSDVMVDLRDFEMPIYSIDRENESGIPDAAQRFFQFLGETDGLIVSYAEHNGSYTAAFKNVFDWASRIKMKVFQGKPQLALATSIGRPGAARALETAASAGPHFGAEIVGHLAVPKFRETFDLENNELSDEALRQELGIQLDAFARRLNGGEG